MSDTTRKVWVVCYDIRDAKRLRSVYRTMRAFGDHIQFSVFRCELSERQRMRLQGQLEQVLKPSEDQVLFVPLGSIGSRAEKGVYTLGVPLTDPERVCYVIG